MAKQITEPVPPRTREDERKAMKAARLPWYYKVGKVETNPNDVRLHTVDVRIHPIYVAYLKAVVLYQRYKEPVRVCWAAFRFMMLICFIDPIRSFLKRHPLHTQAEPPKND